jgi:hypothetical protein
MTQQALHWSSPQPNLWPHRPRSSRYARAYLGRRRRPTGSVISVTIPPLAIAPGQSRDVIAALCAPRLFAASLPDRFTSRSGGFRSHAVRSRCDPGWAPSALAARATERQVPPRIRERPVRYEDRLKPLVYRRLHPPYRRSLSRGGPQSLTHYGPNTFVQRRETRVQSSL